MAWPYPLAGACEPDMLYQLRNGLLDGVRTGRIPMSRIDEAVNRVMQLKVRYQVGPAPMADLSHVGGASNYRIVKTKTVEVELAPGSAPVIVKLD